jgi:hypothetical protein
MSVCYNVHDLLLTYVFDGRFNACFILSGYRHEGTALAPLRTLASIVEPFMERHGIRIDPLKKFFREHPKLLGQNDGTLNSIGGTHTTHTIHVRLRAYNGPSAFFPPAIILQAMCHELAHCWIYGHKDDFLREWKSIMEEVHTDLGGTLRFRHLPESSRYKESMDDFAKGREWLVVRLVCGFVVHPQSYLYLARLIVVFNVVVLVITSSVKGGISKGETLRGEALGGRVGPLGTRQWFRAFGEGCMLWNGLGIWS